MKNILFLTLIAFVSLSACKDDTADPTPKDETKTNTDLLTDAHWQMEEGTIVPSIDVEIVPGTVITVNNYWDLLSYVGGGEVLDCDKDNYMECNLDSTVVMDEGPTKCDPMDPQTTDGGKWEFEENETKVNFSSFPMDPTGEPRIMDVDLLTTTNMTLTMKYTFVDPIGGGTTDHDIVLKYLNVK